MASAKLFINIDKLECAICVEPWLNNNPRTLPCQHTFCLKCLQRLRAVNYVKCPVCRQESNVPGKDISNFPKCLLINAIEEDYNTNENCSLHNKKAFKPHLCCKTCKKLNICSDCIEIDHSKPNCNIVTFNSLEIGLNKLKQNYMKSINEQIEYDSRNQDTILNEFEKSKKEFYLKIDEYFQDTRKKLMNYYEKKSLKLKFNSKDKENLFLNENDIDKKLLNLSNDQLTLISNEGLKFYFEIDFIINQEHSDSSLKQLFKLGGGNLSVNEPCSSCCLTKDGFYYFDYFETNRIFFTTIDNEINPPTTVSSTLSSSVSSTSSSSLASTSPPVPKIRLNLDRDIEKYTITENYIFAIDTKTKSVIYSKKPFKTPIIFELFDSTKTNSLKANEDNFNQIYTLCYSNENKECKFFINKIYEWSIFDCLDIGCILNNGYPIIKTIDHKLLMLEKRTGITLKSIECPENSFIYDFSPYGILMTSESETYKSDTILFLYNYNLRLIKKIAKFKKARLIGTSPLNIFCICFTEDKRYKFYEFR